MKRGQTRAGKVLGGKAHGRQEMHAPTLAQKVHAYIRCGLTFLDQGRLGPISDHQP